MGHTLDNPWKSRIELSIHGEIVWERRRLKKGLSTKRHKKTYVVEVSPVYEQKYAIPAAINMQIGLEKIQYWGVQIAPRMFLPTKTFLYLTNVEKGFSQLNPQKREPIMSQSMSFKQQKRGDRDSIDGKWRCSPPGCSPKVQQQEEEIAILGESKRWGYWGTSLWRVSQWGTLK